MSQVCADTECYGLHLDIKDTGKMYDNVQYEVRNVYYQMDDIRQQLMKFNDSELSGAAWSALKTHFDEYRFVIFGYETAMRQFMNQISKFDSAASSGIAGDTCLDEVELTNKINSYARIITKCQSAISKYELLKHTAEAAGLPYSDFISRIDYYSRKKENATDYKEKYEHKLKNY
ncbi:MAG: T7SS effector LXG polymorphic toxin [Catonella sp.]|nr:T7SS effector LXG polymorphic toxin [Catonella sp.]